jgi:DNA-binding NarL/FixJ family response regulator
MKKDHLHILLLDDDDVDTQAIIRMLQKTQPHWQVTALTEAQAVFDQLAHTDYDLLLLDYLLPSGTGLDVLRELRKKKRELPVIVLSGHTSQSVAVELLRHGASDYLIKDDLRAERLVTTIETVLSADRSATLARQQAHLLEQIMQATGGLVGRAYMQSLAQALSRSLKIEHVLIAAFHENICRSEALFSHGVQHAAQELPKTHPLCHDVTESRRPILAGKMSVQFHHLTLSGKVFAISIRNSHGQVIGMMALFDEQLSLTGMQRDLLELSAARVGAEMERSRMENELIERIRIERALSRCACALLSHGNTPMGIQQGLAHLLETCHGQTIALYAANEHEKNWHCQYAIGKTGGDMSAYQKKYDDCPQRWREYMKTDRIIACDIIYLPSDEQDWLVESAHSSALSSTHSSTIASLVVVPLFHDGHCLGAIRIDSATPHQWTREEVALLRNGCALFAANIKRHQEQRPLLHNAS